MGSKRLSEDVVGGLTVDSYELTMDAYRRAVAGEAVCWFCLCGAEGNYAVFDGSDACVEVPLCNECGASPTPTLPEIWDRIADRKAVGQDGWLKNCEQLKPAELAKWRKRLGGRNAADVERRLKAEAKRVEIERLMTVFPTLPKQLAPTKKRKDRKRPPAMDVGPARRYFDD